MPRKKQQILVVEDEASLNDAYTTVLNKEGFDVLSAHDGKEALEALTDNEPDLILLDLRMPRMDGLTFLRNFEPRKHGDTKVIVFSNYDVQDEIDEAFGLGASHYILKAFASPKELVHAVKETLSKR